MPSVSSALKKLIFLLVIIMLAVTYQQYDVYHKFSNKVVRHDTSNRQQLLKLEKIKIQKEEFYQRLAEISSRYEVLTSQLPDDMQLVAFRKSLEEQFAQEGITILTHREAHYSRSSYNEVRLTYSLKAEMHNVKQIINKLVGEKRLIVIDEPRDEGNNTVSFGFSIFSLSKKIPITTKKLKCLSIPDMLVLPFFVAEINPLYQEYLQTCHDLSENEALYLDIQRYEQTLEAVQQLDEIHDEIVRKQKK